MRIVYLYPSMAIYGGIERIFVDKMNLLVQLYGYDVTLVTSDQGSHAIPFELDAQVRHIDLDIRFHQRYRYGLLRRWWEYRRLKRLYAARLRQTLTELHALCWYSGANSRTNQRGLASRWFMIR